MSLEQFRIPKTPESRTPYVLLLLGAIAIAAAAIRGVWRMLTGSSFGVEIVIVAAAGAVAYAIVRFLRQRQT